MTNGQVQISEFHKEQYRTEGYFFLENAIPDEHLQLLRDECGYFIDLLEREMGQAGAEKLNLSHRNKRYFVSRRYKESRRLHEFLFSDLMAAITRAILGDEVYLFYEQFVVKGAEVGMPFAWHQDSGYLGYDHEPYLSCWCALDDMSEENGTVYILPYSRAGTRRRQPHAPEEASGDLVGYDGDDPGVAAVMPAGSIAVFSSVNFHRSGTNTSERMRRVYLAQYSSYPIMTEDGSELRGFADPFLKNGEKVALPAGLEKVGGTARSQ